MKRKITLLALLALIFGVSAFMPESSPAQTDQPEEADVVAEDPALQPTTIQELFGQAELWPVVSEQYRCGYILTLTDLNGALAKLGFKNRDLIYSVNNWHFCRSAEDDLKATESMNAEHGDMTIVRVLRPGGGNKVFYISL